MHRHILANLFPGNHLLTEHSRCPSLERITPLFLLPLVRRDEVPQQRRFLLRDNAHIHIRPGPQIVEYPRLDRLRRQLYRPVPRHVRRPLRLEDRHRRQRAAAHRHVGQLVGAAVRVHGEEADPGRVDSRHDEVRADVALVAEEVLFQHCHAGDDAGLAAGGQGVQFEVGGDDGGREFGVGSGARASAPYLRGDVM